MSPISGDSENEQEHRARPGRRRCLTRSPSGRGTGEPYARSHARTLGSDPITASYRGLTPTWKARGRRADRALGTVREEGTIGARRARVDGSYWLGLGPDGPGPKIPTDDAVSDPRLERRTARGAGGDPAALAREPRARPARSSPPTCPATRRRSTSPTAASSCRRSPTRASSTRCSRSASGSRCASWCRRTTASCRCWPPPATGSPPSARPSRSRRPRRSRSAATRRRRTPG